MKLLKKSIVKLKTPIPVYDIEVNSPYHNYCLGNGVIVHNSKDLADAVCGAVSNLYNHLDIAGQLSRKYRIDSHVSQLATRIDPTQEKYNRMLNLFNE